LNGSSGNFTRGRRVLWLGECRFRSQNASFLSRLQTLDRLGVFLGLTALIYENKKDNAVAVIWLSDNFPLGISNNKDI
jgi:hypothetical protein